MEKLSKKRVAKDLEGIYIFNRLCRIYKTRNIRKLYEHLCSILGWKNDIDDRYREMINVSRTINLMNIIGEFKDYYIDPINDDEFNQSDKFIFLDKVLYGTPNSLHWLNNKKKLIKMIRNTIFHAPDDNNKYSINSDGSIDINVDETPRNSEELKIHLSQSDLYELAIELNRLKKIVPIKYIIHYKNENEDKNDVQNYAKTGNEKAIIKILKNIEIVREFHVNKQHRFKLSDEQCENIAEQLIEDYKLHRKCSIKKIIFKNLEFGDLKFLRQIYDYYKAGLLINQPQTYNKLMADLKHRFNDYAYGKKNKENYFVKKFDARGIEFQLENLEGILDDDTNEIFPYSDANNLLSYVYTNFNSNEVNFNKFRNAFAHKRFTWYNKKTETSEGNPMLFFYDINDLNNNRPIVNFQELERHVEPTMMQAGWAEVKYFDELMKGATDLIEPSRTENEQEQETRARVA